MPNDTPVNNQAEQRKLESEIEKNRAECHKAELEAEEIQKRLNVKWYSSRLFLQALVAGIIGAGLFGAWVIGYLRPILRLDTEIAERETEINKLDNEIAMKNLAKENQLIREELANISLLNAELQKQFDILAQKAGEEDKERYERLARKAERTSETITQQLKDHKNERFLLVTEMFSPDKTTRINATTKLIREWSVDPNIVDEALEYAMQHRSHKSGVINTLVLLENIDPDLLMLHRQQIIPFLDAVEGHGPQTASHVKNVRRRMGLIQ